jgi:hypothetical protein
MRLRHGAIAAAALLLAVGATLFPLVAEAGCMLEFEDCADCAKKMMRAGFKRRDLDLMLDGWGLAVDCEIDLYHCIVLGKHHETRCRI